MYEEMKSTNKSNLESVEGMQKEFEEEIGFMEKKFSYIEENNPFDANTNLINKIYDNIILTVNKKREETLKKMAILKDNYMKNIQQNISKIQNMIDKSQGASTALKNELKSMEKKSPFDFCQDLLKSNISSDLADECNEIAVFQRQEFTRIKQSFIDTNTIVFNDSNSLIEQCKNLRELLLEKITKFFSFYSKYQSKYAFTVVMNLKEFIVYLIDANKITKVTYENDFVIPCYARWINISGDKLILCGGEKDYIESLNTTYMFSFSKYNEQEETFGAKVAQKCDMLYRRRAHSLIYANDFIYSISGVDKLEMIRKCEKYDIFNDKWIEVPELNLPRQNAALAIHNMRYLFAFCGYDGFKNMDSFERLDCLKEEDGKLVIQDGASLSLKV